MGHGPGMALLKHHQEWEIQMGELAAAMKMLQGGFSTAIQQVNYPVHQGKPNPKHGMFFFVGSIPANCYEPEHDNGPFSPKGMSKFYATLDEAIAAAKAGGATRIQRPDCSFV